MNYWESQTTSKSQHEFKKDSGVPVRYNTLLDGCLKAGMADEGEASRDLLMLQCLVMTNMLFDQALEMIGVIRILRRCEQFSYLLTTESVTFSLG